MPPEDAEAGQAIADEVLAVLTAEQRAALQRVREQARERVGPPGGQGAGPPDPTRRAEFRRRAIERAIRLLEGKIPSAAP